MEKKPLGMVPDQDLVETLAAGLAMVLYVHDHDGDSQSGADALDSLYLGVEGDLAKRTLAKAQRFYGRLLELEDG